MVPFPTLPAGSRTFAMRHRQRSHQARAAVEAAVRELEDVAGIQGERGWPQAPRRHADLIAALLPGASSEDCAVLARQLLVWFEYHPREVARALAVAALAEHCSSGPRLS